MTNKPDPNKSETSQIGTEQSGEQISSLVDGEFENNHGDESGIDHLVTNKAAKHSWESYHLISDALKRNLPRFIDNQFASRVMAELENEPTVLAPSRINSLIGKQVAGLAIAASVATVAVLGVQFMYKEDPMAPSSQVAQINVPGNQGSGLQASKSPIRQEFINRDIQTVTQAVNPADSRSQQLAQQLAEKRQAQLLEQYHPNLSKYLLNHNQRAARGVFQGVIPYARIITNPDVERIASQINLQKQSQHQIQR
jgi:sigma-E factor negative regulatory protein RseA